MNENHTRGVGFLLLRPSSWKRLLPSQFSSRDSLPLAWDVKIHVLSLVVDHGVLSSGASLRLLSSPSAFDSGPWLLFRFDDRRRRNSQHFQPFSRGTFPGNVHLNVISRNFLTVRKRGALRQEHKRNADQRACSERAQEPLLRAQAKERESKRRACVVSLPS